MLAALLLAAVAALPNATALKLRPVLVREAQFAAGLGAPVALFAAQIQQESAWRPGITAWDNGRGLAQFMDGTARTVAGEFPELGAPAPYDPVWAMRALVRYDWWLYTRVAGADDCERWGAALKSYNAGIGYVLRAQRRSRLPLIWFGATEFIPSGQSTANFEASRQYPRRILFLHQARFAGWSARVCPATITGPP